MGLMRISRTGFWAASVMERQLRTGEAVAPRQCADWPIKQGD
jgi:hypothetical protein